MGYIICPVVKYIVHFFHIWGEEMLKRIFIILLRALMCMTVGEKSVRADYIGYYDYDDVVDFYDFS